MIKIIEHKDYNKPVDNTTVVKLIGYNKQNDKLFKVCDGIWISPNPVKNPAPMFDKEDVLATYQEDYCQSVDQKSKYLEQMTILFKRINLSPVGQKLLEHLSKGAPIDFGKDAVWNSHNVLITSKNPKGSESALNIVLRVSCIITPSSCYLYNYAKTGTFFEKNNINTRKAWIFFHPNCVEGLRSADKVSYFDPAIVLYHELLHVCHALYGIGGVTDSEEEFLTFGHHEALPYWNKEKEYYKNMQSILKVNLYLLKKSISLLKNPLYRKCFQDKYGFTENTVINDTFIEHYINKYVVQQSEYNFAKSLNLKDSSYRHSYKVSPFPSFKFDISDPTVYTVKNGLLHDSDTIKSIIENPSNLFTKLDANKAADLIFKPCNVKLNPKLVSEKQTDQELHDIIDFVVSKESRNSDPTIKSLSIWEAPAIIDRSEGEESIKDYFKFKDTLDYDAYDADRQIDTLVQKLKSQK